MRLKTRLVLLVGAGVLALSALPQVAFGAFTFSDSMTVTDGNGIVLAQIKASEESEASDPQVLYLLDHTVANIGQWGNATAVFEEVGGDTVISDVFGVARDPNAPTHYYLGFMSAAEGVSLDPVVVSAWFGTVPNAVQETLANNGVFDASIYVDPSYNGPGGHATFWSPVPEPTTMIAGALLLLPFGASTLRMLRKNRTA
jgi:hypothetical protein